MKKFSKVLLLSLSTFLVISANPIANANGLTSHESDRNSAIPLIMKPGTILKYENDLTPTITFDTKEIITSVAALETTQNFSGKLTINKEVPDIKGREKENQFFEKVKKEVEELGLPTIQLGYDLPNPEPGLVVIYGTDGQINRYYYEQKDNNKLSTSSTIPTTTVPYPGRLAAGVYEYGTNQKITITTGAVTGEGRFTVFRNGVGGSGSVGSSGKTLGAGDVATKRQIDNPKHNTALTARAIDTDIVKTVYKNDIGTMNNAVLDVYFWGWNDVFFGYTYSDTLSFSGRYYYQF